MNALYQGKVGPLVTGLAQPVRDFGLAEEDFLAVIDGMEMDTVEDIRAPDLRHARSLLRPSGERSRTIVGARVRSRPRRRHSALPIILGARCSSPISCATSTRMPTSAASICRASALTEAGISTSDPADGIAQPRARHRSAAALVERAREHFAEANAIMARSPRQAVRAPRIMGEVYRVILEGMVARGWAAAAPARARLTRPARLDSAALRDRLMPRTIHIIGAGLAGLSAAVELTARGRYRRRA